MSVCAIHSFNEGGYIGGGGALAGQKALHTCTPWYPYAAMFGSSYSCKQFLRLSPYLQLDGGGEGGVGKSAVSTGADPGKKNCPAHCARGM